MKKLFFCSSLFLLLLDIRAQEGTLDPTFGTDGFVRLSAGYDATAFQSDGKLVVVQKITGGFTLTRYNTDGRADAGFGNRGTVSTQIPYLTAASTALIAIDPSNDNIVVHVEGSSSYATPNWTSYKTLALARFTSNGEPDAGFGSDGFVLRNVQVATSTIYPEAVPNMRFLAVQTNGNIVTAGNYGLYRQSYAGVTTYNHDGTLNGSTRLQPDTYTSVTALATGKNGQIVVGIAAQSAYWPYTFTTQLVGLSPSIVFGYITGYAGGYGSLAIQDDGKVLAVFAGLTRFQEDGSVDLSFGNEGTVTPGIGVAQILVQENGNITVGGQENNDFTLARFHSSGAVDPTFGNGGKVTTDFGGTESIRDMIFAGNRLYAYGNGILAAYLPINACTPPTFLNNSLMVKDASCGRNDGSIYLIPTSGTAPFLYSIDGGQTYVSGPNSGYSFDHLVAGSYELRLKDAAGCTSEVVNRVVSTTFGCVPLIAAVSPLSGPVGTTVTITGSNFDPVATHNIVSFGAVKATVLSASTTSLTVTVPGGASYQPITVTTNGLTASSNQSFVVTFPTACEVFADNSFSPQANLPAPGHMADLDSDGRPDVLTIDADTVFIFRNISTNAMAAYAPKVALETGSSLALGDLDGDGKPDLAVVRQSFVSVFRNTSTPGTVSFAPGVDYAAASSRDVAIGDLDRDRKPDIVVPIWYQPGRSGPVVSVFRNTGEKGMLSFAARKDFGNGPGSNGVLLSDFDGDGKPDILLKVGFNYASNGILRNTSVGGSLSFDSLIPFAAAGAAIGDLNGDGKPDVAVANSASGTVSFYRNTGTNGTIAFTKDGEYGTGSDAFNLAIGDLNGDGKPDVAVANASSKTISLLQNKTGGSGLSFHEAKNYPVESASQVFIGDVDGDGIPDLSNGVVVFRNRMSEVPCDLPPVSQPPVITTFSPVSGPVGTTVTITGSNFDPVATHNIVFFGAVKATVTAAAATSLTVTVPAGATYEPLSVTTIKSNLTAASSKAFDVTFGSGGIGPTSFAPKTELPAASGVRFVRVSDFDGDGKTDLLAGSSSGSFPNVSVYKNTSSDQNISFTDRSEIGNGAAEPYDAAIGDLNGDGKPDVVITDNFYKMFRVSVNKSTAGNIAFETGIGFAHGGYNASLAIGDLDGDGKPDVVVTGGNETASIFRNTGTGGTVSFAAKTEIQTENGPNGVAIADLNGDGKPELVLANYNVQTPPPHTISILQNTSTRGVISFVSKVDYEVQNHPQKVAIADFDGDGKPDIAVCSPNGTSILRNVGTGETLSFSERTDYVTGFSIPEDLVAGDFDGDGKVDLAVTNKYGFVSLLRNLSTNGTIAFAETVEYPTESNPYNRTSIAAADFNNDGKPDLAVTSPYSSKIFILRYQVPSCTAPTFLNNGTMVKAPDCGQSNGSIYLIPTSGTAPFQYSKDGGATYVAGPAAGYNFEGLSAGTYQLRMKDALGCESEVITKEVTAPGCPINCSTPPTLLNNLMIISHATCGKSDGALYAIPTSGNAPFQYSKDGGATYVSGPEAGYTFSNLAPGIYQLRIKDASGCQSELVQKELLTLYCDCATATTKGKAAQRLRENNRIALVYPNPSTGTFKLQLSGLASQLLQVQVFNSKGQMVEQRRVNVSEGVTMDFDLSQKAKGLYLIRVVSDKGVTLTKVLLQ